VIIIRTKKRTSYPLLCLSSLPLDAKTSHSTHLVRLRSHALTCIHKNTTVTPRSIPSIAVIGRNRVKRSKDAIAFTCTWAHTSLSHRCMTWVGRYVCAAEEYGCFKAGAQVGRTSLFRPSDLIQSLINLAIHHLSTWATTTIRMTKMRRI
jgi:hypothetical protein